MLQPLFPILHSISSVLPASFASLYPPSSIPHCSYSSLRSLFSILHPLSSILHASFPNLHPPSSIFHAPTSILYPPFSTLYPPSFMLHSPAFIIHLPSPVIHTPSFILFSSFSILYLPSFMLHSPAFMLYPSSSFILTSPFSILYPLSIYLYSPWIHYPPSILHSQYAITSYYISFIRFLLRYENFLRKVDCRVTLPYWDWSLFAKGVWRTGIDDIWSNKPWGLGGNGRKKKSHRAGCVKTGRFSQRKWRLTPSAKRGCLRRKFSGTVYIMTAIPFDWLLYSFRRALNY